MPQIALNDRTYLKNDKKEKQAWIKASKRDKAKTLSHWIRSVLNHASFLGAHVAVPPEMIQEITEIRLRTPPPATDHKSKDDQTVEGHD